MCCCGLRVAFGVLATTSTVAWAGPASRPALPPAPAGVTIKQNVEYLESGRRERLDLYLPADRSDGRHFPGVVIIHGGGWSGGDKAAGREFNIGTSLAKAGYVCASVNYMMDPGKRWPTNLKDCKNAVRFLRTNAARYAVDSEHIGVIGGSAGGHLALMVAYTAGVPEFSPEQPYPGVSDKVDAVVDFYGITDLLTWQQSREADGQVTSRPVKHSPLLEESAEEDLEAWRRASPVSYISAKCPPTLIAHGTKDTTVDSGQATELAAKLKKAGVEHQLILLPGIGHTFDLEKWNRKPLPVDMRREVIGFFDKHLKRTSDERH